MKLNYHELAVKLMEKLDDEYGQDIRIPNIPLVRSLDIDVDKDALDIFEQILKEIIEDAIVNQ